MLSERLEYLTAATMGRAMGRAHFVRPPRSHRPARTTASKPPGSPPPLRSSARAPALTAAPAVPPPPWSCANASGECRGCARGSGREGSERSSVPTGPDSLSAHRRGSRAWGGNGHDSTRLRRQKRLGPALASPRPTEATVDGEGHVEARTPAHGATGLRQSPQRLGRLPAPLLAGSGAQPRGVGGWRSAVPATGGGERCAVGSWTPTCTVMRMAATTWPASADCALWWAGRQRTALQCIVVAAEWAAGGGLQEAAARAAGVVTARTTQPPSRRPPGPLNYGWPACQG